MEEKRESILESGKISKSQTNQSLYVRNSLNINKDLEYEILTEEDTKPDLAFKIIIIGNSGVGKSCLSLKASKNIFNKNNVQTIGFECFDFNICFEKKERIKLQIWDTCGQEVYRSFISNFFRNSSLAIIVYSIIDKKSFDCIEGWLKELKEKSNPDIKIFLLGNKADLEDEREVKYEDGEQLKNMYDFLYFNETSAKTGLNVTEVFVEAAKLLYNDYLKYEKIPVKRMSISIKNDRSSNIILNKNKIKVKRKKHIACCL